MKILLRPIPAMLAVIICAGLSVLSCGDKDRVTEPLTPEYLDVYVVTTINGKPFESEVIVGRHLPAMLNIRLDEDTNTFSGYVQITDVGWLPISEYYTFERDFWVTAPDSLGVIEYFGFHDFIYNPPVLSGWYFAGGSSLDPGGFTFEATLTPVPAENVMNDEYYFAAGPGKTKVFVVESIGGYPLDKLPAEWGDVYPTLLELKYVHMHSDNYTGRIYLTTFGWIDQPWTNPGIWTGSNFWIALYDSLYMEFSELHYDPPVLSGMYLYHVSREHLPRIKQLFISRRTVMSIDDLPK